MDLRGGGNHQTLGRGEKVCAFALDPFGVVDWFVAKFFAFRLGYSFTERSGMKTPNFKVGMLVDHPARPQWGPGRIVAVDEMRIHVFFKGEIEQKAKTIMREGCKLTVCDEQSDVVLDELPTATYSGGEWMLPRQFEKTLQKAADARAKEEAKLARMGK
jgi:hypothetical protein